MARFDVGGAASGAMAGASAGGSFGPVGAGVGAVAGGLLGMFSRRKKKPKKLSTMDPTQQQLYNQTAQGVQGQGPFADMYNFNPEQATDVFNQMYAQPAYQQFQEEIVPGITGQFRGGNLQNSSYMAGALGKAGTDVQRNLNAQMAQMLYQGQQASIDRRINSINNLMNMQTFAYQKPQASPFDTMLDSFSGGAGKYAGQAAGQKFASWMNPQVAATGAGG